MISHLMFLQEDHMDQGGPKKIGKMLSSRYRYEDLICQLFIDGYFRNRKAYSVRLHTHLCNHWCILHSVAPLTRRHSLRSHANSGH